MNSPTIIKLLLMIILECILISCSVNNNQHKINLFVSIEPQKFFVEKIGGNKVDVSVFVKSGMSPENFEPLPAQLVKLSNSDIFFAIGMPFESRIKDNIQSANPSLKIIDTGANIKHRQVESSKNIFGTHKSSGEESHEQGEYDPHIWLSPSLAKILCKNIYNSLIEIDGTNKEYYKNNLDKFTAELDSAVKIISANLEKINNRNLLVFHPAWGYFCDEFNLKQIPIEIEGKEPGMKDLSNLLSYIKNNNNKFILAEVQNNSPSLNLIREDLKIKIIKHDPLAGNYIENLVLLSKIIMENNK